MNLEVVNFCFWAIPRPFLRILWEHLIGEPLRWLTRNYALTVRVEVDVVNFVTPPVGTVVATRVDGLVLNSEGK